jgi:glycosyltransferase involved in cell wall biosynthesis
MQRTGSPLVLFIGSLGWSPNAAAARYLVHDVFPQLRSKVADARLRIIGRDAPPDVSALSCHGVDVLTDVPDVRPHLAEAHVIAVPLESGGGSRLKILEAFAAGVPVVSTPVGCEGLAVMSDQHLIIVPRERIADAVVSLLRDPSRARRLAQQARQLVEREYDWAAVGSRASDAVASVLKADPNESRHRAKQLV